MLERKSLGHVSQKPHTVFTVNDKTAAEYVLTRDGFAGGFSILYLEEAPTAISKSQALPYERYHELVGEAIPFREQPLSRKHIQNTSLEAGKDFLSSRKALFCNESCRVSVTKGSLSLGEQSFVNSDFDELYFIYEGEGTLCTMFGQMPIKKHDYVLIPKGVAYYFQEHTPLETMVTEGRNLSIPQDFLNPHGQLKLEAPYTHRDFRSPKELLSSTQALPFNQQLSLRNGCITELSYIKNPHLTLGWDGSVYPIAFDIHDYLPKTGKIHLPPNLHLTFKADRFVICSFVPRMVDYGEGAIPCPYPHANVECDEVLYYVSGDFTSRQGIKNKSLSFHPAGLPHGPQPGKYLKSVGAKTTNELAVMVDTWDPLNCTVKAMGLEDPAYQTSWAKY